MDTPAIKREAMRDGIVKRGKSYSYVVYKDGKYFWKGGFETRVAAKSARARALVAIADRNFVEPAKVILEDFLTSWIEIHSRSIKESTAASYRSALRNYLIPSLGHLKVQEIRASHLEKFIGEMLASGGRNGSPLSAQTVSYSAALLKMALNYAVEVEGLIAVSPAKNLTVVKGKSKRRGVWSFEELEVFLAGMKTHRLYLFFHLAAFTGARRGELLALRWSDFDGKALSISKSRVTAGSATIEQNTTKGGENGQRRVLLDPLTIEELTQHRKRQIQERLLVGVHWADLDYIFAQEDGNPLYVSTPTALFTKWSQSLGLRDMNLHGLRHLHATELLRLGEPLHVVAQRLGHRDAMVTATIYAHVTNEQGETAANRFANAAKRGA
jgi:integrase